MACKNTQKNTNITKSRQNIAYFRRWSFKFNQFKVKKHKNLLI